MPELTLGGLGGEASESKSSRKASEEGDDDLAVEGVQASLEDAFGKSVSAKEARAFMQAIQFATGKL